MTENSALPVPHCDSCTVEVEHVGDLCTWCARHMPPVDGGPVRLIDTAANYASIALEDLQDFADALPANTSLWVSVDITRAMRHLRGAIRLIERVGAQLDAQAVTK